VLKVSLGATGAWSPLTQGAIDEVVRAGATVIASAGNNGTSVANYSPANCERVIAVGARAIDAGEDPVAIGRDAAEQGLELLGLVGMHDPPRAHVSAAIAACRAAGVRVAMVTGDPSRTGVQWSNCWHAAAAKIDSVGFAPYARRLRMQPPELSRRVWFAPALTIRVSTLDICWRPT